jgi:hypothetical protein
MSNSTFIAISFALGFVVYFTVMSVRDLRAGNDALLRETGRWLKNVIDSLFGAG